MKRIFTITSFFLLVISFQAVCSGSIIQGQVRYNNADSTALFIAKVVLFDSLGTRIDSTMTDISGLYYFTNLTDGKYVVTAFPNHPWGGVNATDALIAIKKYVQMINLQGIFIAAGNVDGFAIINATDALIIQKRYANLLTSFPIGDWVSETITINTTETSTYYHNIKVLCSGDLNASYVPVNNAMPCPGLPTIVYGGITYHTVQIYTQCWMKENLNIGTMINGSLNQTNNNIIEKYCFNNDNNNCTIYGALYQWNEMMQYVTAEGAQGICPTGWHLPSKPEITLLLLNLGGASVAGDKMKEKGLTHWNSATAGTNNISGFTALGSGRRYSGYMFGGLRDYFDAWTSSAYDTYNANNLYIYGTGNAANQGSATKEDGFAARCLKDSQ